MFEGSIMIVCISDHNNIVKIIPCLGTSQPGPAILVARGQNHDIYFIGIKNHDIYQLLKCIEHCST